MNPEIPFSANIKAKKEYNEGELTIHFIAMLLIYEASAMAMAPNHVFRQKIFLAHAPKRRN